MKQLILFVIGLVIFSEIAFAGPVVEIKTSQGNIQIALDSEKAPVTVKNFLEYVDHKFYDGIIFHRIINGFMIQGGGYDKNEKRQIPMASIKNEADNGLKNCKGSIAMARTSAIDSASSQFFINLADNDFLNHCGTIQKTFGYAVFGQVIAGMNVVQKIGNVKTIAKSTLFRDYPEPQVVIESIRRVEP